MSASLAPLSDSMWRALGFFACVDRWRQEEHQRVVPKVSVRGLWRRGMVETYPHLTEAWMLPDGLDYLIAHLADAVVEARPMTAPRTPWREIGRFKGPVVRNRLGMLAQVETMKSKAEATRRTQMATQIVFLRKPE